MNISEARDVLNTQVVIGKTPKGRPLTDYAKQCITTSMEDDGNAQADVSECLNCGMIVSVLLTDDGCPNCGGLDFNSNIDASKIAIKE